MLNLNRWLTRRASSQVVVAESALTERLDDVARLSQSPGDQAALQRAVREYSAAVEHIQATTRTATAYAIAFPLALCGFAAFCILIGSIGWWRAALTSSLPWGPVPEPVSL